jgi:hypothetical protein
MVRDESRGDGDQRTTWGDEDDGSVGGTSYISYRMCNSIYRCTVYA